MMNRQLIQTYFEAYINSVTMFKPEVRQFLLRHERKELFFNNMLKEIRQIELQPLKFGIVDFEQVVKDMTRMFCLAALRSKEIEVKSKDQLMFDMIQKNPTCNIDEELPEECISVERV